VKIRKGRAALLAFVLGLNAPGIAQRPIFVAESHELILALLKPDGWTRRSGFTLFDENIPRYSGYYTITAIGDNPGGGNTIGHFAIDRATGDVWEWVICGSYNSLPLEKAQETLRRRIGLDRTEYKRIRQNPPWCEPGQKPIPLKIGRPAW
jgi:hypothetical protein